MKEINMADNLSANVRMLNDTVHFSIQFYQRLSQADRQSTFLMPFGGSARDIEKKLKLNVF